MRAQEQQMPQRFRAKVKNREALAIDKRADILDLLMADAIVPNTRCGVAEVVSIRGPLEHHACPYGDSYEQIRERFAEAMASDAECIVLRIDSPGGVVSGLNETVFAMQRAKTKPVYAYVDELCASAAYALACAADEISIPPSGIAGSVGVISLMVDQVAADKKDGLNFVTITSGARKGDSHPHSAITDDAIAAEAERVDGLAAQFFEIVKAARGIDAKKLEAGVFLGENAVATGLADNVTGWEELLENISLAHSAGMAQLDTTSKPTERSVGKAGATSMLPLKALIAKTKAAIKAEKRASARATLRASLAAYQSTLAAIEASKKTKYRLEEETTEESDDEDKKDEPSEEEESEEAEESEGDEEPKEEEDDSEESEASEEEESEDDDEPKKAKSKKSEESEEKAIAALIGNLKGAARGKAAGALASLVAKANERDAMRADVARLKNQEIKREMNAAIDRKLAGGYITKTEAKELRSQSAQHVKFYLSMRKTKLFNREEDAFVPGDRPGASGGFSEKEEDMFSKAAAASGGKLTVDQLKANYLKNPNAANGVSKVRY